MALETHSRAWTKSIVWERIKWGRVMHPLSSLPVNKELTPEDLQLIRSQLKDLGYLE